MHQRVSFNLVRSRIREDLVCQPQGHLSGSWRRAHPATPWHRGSKCFEQTQTNQVLGQLKRLFIVEHIHGVSMSKHASHKACFRNLSLSYVLVLLLFLLPGSFHGVKVAVVLLM